MTVNNYRNEYIKLSMAIKRAKEKGLDPNQLITQREQLKQSYQSVNNVNAVNKHVNKSIRLTVNQELLTTIQELKKQLSDFTHQINEQKAMLTEFFTTVKTTKDKVKRKPIDEAEGECKGCWEICYPLKEVDGLNYCSACYKYAKEEQREKKQAEQSGKKWVREFLKIPKEVAKQEPKKVIVETETISDSNKITFSFNANILANIQTFLKENSHSFPSFSYFVRAALVAYREGMTISQQPFSTSKKDCLKKSLRMDRELQSIYRTLPEGKKTLILNQILSSFLTKQIINAENEY